jgi:hypothetical protein
MYLDTTCPPVNPRNVFRLNDQGVVSSKFICP